MMQLIAAYTIASVFLFLGVCGMAGFIYYDKPNGGNCLIFALVMFSFAYAVARVAGI